MGLVGRWTAATIMGELLGFLFPTAIGLAFVRWAEPTAGWIVAGVAAAALGGAGEGAVLGWFQGRMLRRFPVGPAQADWVWATAGGAAIAWACGMGAAAAAQARPTLPGVALAAGIGIGGLAALPWLQWRLLRAWPRSRWWIPGSMAAWALGVAIVVMAIGAVADGAPPWVWGAAAMAGAVVMGAVVGVVTGRLLDGLLASSREG